MFWLRNKKLLSWSMKILLFLVACTFILLYDSPLKLDKAVAVWAALTGLVIIGGVFLMAPLKLRGQPFLNRWYRAAYRAGWPFCALPGACLSARQ